MCMGRVGIDPTGLSTEEKIKALGQYREAKYNLMMDAIYERRGWDKNGIPPPEKLKQLGVGLPELLEVVERARKSQ